MGNMNEIFELGRSALNGIENRLGMSRRDYLQFCATLAVTMGLPKGADAAVAKAIESAKRPSVIWLHFQECTGCTESMLRAEHPDAGETDSRRHLTRLPRDPVGRCRASG